MPNAEGRREEQDLCKVATAGTRNVIKSCRKGQRCAWKSEKIKLLFLSVMGYLLWLLILRSLQWYPEDKQQDLAISAGKQVSAGPATTEIFCATRDALQPSHDVSESVSMIPNQSWDLWVSSLLSLVKAHSLAYLWPQLTMEASYNIPESTRGWHQKDKAATSTCKRVLKSPAELQITAHHRGVKTQQPGGRADCPCSQKEGSRLKEAIIQTACKHFGSPTDFIPINDTRSREDLHWTCGGLSESWDKYISCGQCDNLGRSSWAVSSQDTDPSLTSFIGYVHNSAKINTLAAFLVKGEYWFSSTNWLMRNWINRADKSSVPPHYLDYIDCEKRGAHTLFMKVCIRTT